MKFGQILMLSTLVKMGEIWSDFNVKCISKERNLV